MGADALRVIAQRVSPNARHDGRPYSLPIRQRAKRLLKEKGPGDIALTGTLRNPHPQATAI